MPKKERPFDLHDFLIGKLRAATRKCPYFNEAKAASKIAVSVEYVEKDGGKWLKVTISENKFTYKMGDIFWVPVLKKMQSRDRVMFCCAECGRLFFDKEYVKNKKGGLKEASMTAIDHVSPVVDERGFQDWNLYVDRMFNGKLQILCNYSGERAGRKSCHHIKTKKEQEARQAYRQKISDTCK